MIVSIGIDVSKLKLDVYCDDKQFTVKNEEKAIRACFKPLDKAKPVVMEATGKYHRLTHKLLTELGFSVTVINPYQGRHFARALNLFCKTDAVDAKLLALYGDKMPCKATPVASTQERELHALSKHVSDLQKVREGLRARARESEGFISRSLNKAIKTLDKEIKATEEKLRAQVSQDTGMQAKCELLCTIPGVGETTAIMLLSQLRELGQLKKTEIAALSGVAPMNNDSGTMQGRRCIRGGRHDVRAKLYMPVMGAATQHNARLKQVYTQFVERGKPKKVALTACMRKLIVWANAMIATNQPWQHAVI